MVPYALGQRVEFEKNFGPKLVLLDLNIFLKFQINQILKN